MIINAKNHRLGGEIAEALGIKNARKIDIHLEVGAIVTVTAEFFPEVDGGKQLVPILRKYRLEESA